MNKYIKCFSENKYKELLENGFEFLFEQNGVYWFENNQSLVKFSDFNVLKDTKTTNVINF